MGNVRLWTGLPTSRQWTEVSIWLPPHAGRQSHGRRLIGQTTVSELTREAIKAHRGPRRAKRKFVFAGADETGESGISGRIKEILRTEWTCERSSSMPVRSRTLGVVGMWWLEACIAFVQ